MKLRLLIPAAIAAFATYTALVRDESRAPAPAGPRDVEPDASGRAPTRITAPSRPATTSPSAPTVETPAPAWERETQTSGTRLPSLYDDLATPEAWDTDQPSVYDLLAGKPPQASAPAALELPAQSDGADLNGPDVAAEVQPALSIGENDPSATAAPAVAPELGGDPWAAPLDEGRFALGGWAAAAGHSMVSAVTFRRRLPVDVTPERIVLSVDSAENIPDNGLVILADPGFAPDRDGFTLCLVAADPGPFSAAGSYRVLPAQGPVSARET